MWFKKIKTWLPSNFIMIKTVILKSNNKKTPPTGCRVIKIPIETIPLSKHQYSTMTLTQTPLSVEKGEIFHSFQFDKQGTLRLRNRSLT